MRDTRPVRGRFLDIELPVEAINVPARNKDRDDRHSDTEQDETAAKLIERFLVAQEEVRGEPVGDGTEHVGNGDKGRFLLISYCMGRVQK